MGLRFFLFCFWFFGLARGLYLCLVILSMVEGRGLASDAKVRGWLWDGRKYATELLFAYLDWNEKGSMKVFFSHTSLYMRKLSGWFSAFHFLVVWFILSFVFLLLCWRIGGYGIFSVLRSVFFRRVGGCAVLGGVLEVVFWFFWWC